MPAAQAGTALNLARTNLLRLAEKLGVPPEAQYKAIVDTWDDAECSDRLFAFWGAGGPELVVRSSTPEAPQLERVGLGYRVRFAQGGVEMRLERIRESRGEIHGELAVQLCFRDRRPSDQLLRASFNVSSLTARKTAATYLSSRARADWAELLERFCTAILFEERRGEEFETLPRANGPQRPGQDYLLEPLLPYKKPTILFAPGGYGKSTLAGAVMVACASGKPVVPGWKPTPGNALLLDWEGETDEWHDRIQRIAAGAGLAPPHIFRLRMARPLADELEKIAAFCNEQCVLLLVVDSLGLAAGGTREGEHWHDGAFRLFGALRQLGVTSLLLDHVASADLDTDQPASKPFGSVYKVNLARNVFELRRERDPNGRAEMLLLQTKTNGPRVPPMGLAIDYGETIRFARAAVAAPELVASLSVADRMIRALSKGPQPTSELAKLVDAKESTIRGVLHRDDGHRFVRTPDGRVANAARHADD